MFLIRNYGPSRSFALPTGKVEILSDHVVKTEDEAAANVMREFDNVSVSTRASLPDEEVTLEYVKARRGRPPKELAKKRMPRIPIIYPPNRITELIGDFDVKDHLTNKVEEKSE